MTELAFAQGKIGSRSARLGFGLPTELSMTLGLEGGGSVLWSDCCDLM